MTGVVSVIMNRHAISTTLYHKTVDLLHSNINSFLVSGDLYADNICKQFGLRSELTFRMTQNVSSDLDKPFDTDIVFLKDLKKNVS